MHTLRRDSRWIRRSVIGTLALLACRGDSPADLEVSWRLGRGTCEAAGVEVVRARLYAFSDDADAARGEVACADGRMPLTDVAPGAYTLLVDGLDAAGCATYGARVDAVDLDPGEDAAVSVLLGLRPRPLEVRWRLAEGLDCATLSADQVEVTVQVGDARPVRGAWLCAVGHARLPEVPAGPARIVLLALDAAGTSVARAEGDFAESALLPAPCAEAFQVELTLEGCASAGCP